MFKAAAALKTFFSGFSIPAYAEGSVPDDVTTPYITFSLSVPEWNTKASLYAQVWDRTTSNAGIIRKADEITEAIGQGRKINLVDGGYLVIWPESPLIQIRADGDFRSAYINLSVNAYHLPGV
ncbi:MAG: hypothetical protein IKQ01_06525 [Bacteroidales bacterium]|nr:hypothetical protein [Bacteroidales bacterium]